MRTEEEFTSTGGRNGGNVAGAMKERIAATRAILADPDAAPFEKAYVVGLLAIAALAGVLTEQDAEEVREVVRGFLGGMAVAK